MSLCMANYSFEVSHPLLAHLLVLKGQNDLAVLVRLVVSDDDLPALAVFVLRHGQLISL